MSKQKSSPGPGRPRSERARRAILRSTAQLLEEGGLGSVTVEAVARRAGVGKPTIYRSWANAQELTMAAILAEDDEADFTAGDADSARRLLQAHLAGLCQKFALPRGRQIAQMMAATESDSELAKAFRNQIILKVRDTGRALLEAGIRTGEIAPQQNMEVVLDMIYGPLFYRLLARHDTLDDSFAGKLAETVFTGIRARDASSRS